MVADFVPQLRYLPDDGFVVAFGNDAEIVAAADRQRMLHAGGCERIAGQPVHGMAKDHGFFTWFLMEAGEGGEGIILVEEGAEEGVEGGDKDYSPLGLMDSGAMPGIV